MSTPTPARDAYTLNQGSTLTINDPLLGILANDTDDGVLTARVKWTTGGGALNFNADGTFTYTPWQGFTGTDYFYYEALDAEGNAVLTEVEIVVNPAQTGGGGTATPAADTYTVSGSSFAATAQDGVLANDGAAAGATAALKWNASFGTVTMQADGAFSYQLAPWATNHPSFNGKDEFFYTVDGGEPVKVSLTVTPGSSSGNKAPVAQADAITLAPAANGRYTGTTVLANDSDANGDAMTASLVYTPGWGSVTLNPDGTFEYTLAPWATAANGYTGTDQFFYKINDGAADSQVVKVSVTVPPPSNAAPVAVADTVEVTLSNGSFTSATSLLANDTDAEGNPLEAGRMWDAGWGTVTVNTDGTFTYKLADWATTANGFTGLDEFFYYAKDATGQSQPVKVSLTNIHEGVVTPPPPPPPPVTPSISVVDDVWQNEDDGNMVFIVRLSEATTQDVTFTVDTLDWDAEAYADYEPVEGQVVTIKAGETEVQVEVAVYADDEVEGDEIFDFQISNVQGATISRDLASGYILNDEVPPASPGIVILESDWTTEMTEGGSDTMTVALASQPADTVTIEVGTDPGVSLNTRTLVFTPANWDQPQELVLTADNDSVYTESYRYSAVYFSPAQSTDPDYSGMTAYDPFVTVYEDDPQPNTAPSAMALAKDTYDTDTVVEVEGFGYDQESASNLTYEIVSQPVEGGTVSLNPDGKTFHFEGDAAFMAALTRGEIQPITFEYRVGDGELWSAPAKITVNVHGTDPGNETIQAFTRTTPSQADFFPLDGKDGTDTVVFTDVTLTSGTGLEISLGKTIKWTEYAGKALVNIENITLDGTNGNPLRTMTVGGDSGANVITITDTSHKLLVNGLGGQDTFHFTGMGAEAAKSVITGGAGADTVYANSAVTIDDRGNGTGLSGSDAYYLNGGTQQVNFYDGHGDDVIHDFDKGEDKLHFLGGGFQAGDVALSMSGSNSVLTVTQNDGTTDTITVKGVALTTADWMFT